MSTPPSPGRLPMIVLLVAPYLLVDTGHVSEIVRKVSWKPDSPPRLLSTISFSPSSPSKFLTDLPLPEQCRFAIQQIVDGTDSQLSSTSNDRSICRVVWIGDGRESDEDCLAVLALHAVCAREFQSKSLIFLGTGEDSVPNESLQLALAHSFPLTRFLETPVRIRDVVAVGRSAEHGAMAIVQDEPLPVLGLDAALLEASFRGWNVGLMVEVESSKLFPLAAFAKGLKLVIDSAKLSTGVYACSINQKWFALVQVKDRENIYLSIAPQVFSSICQQTADAHRKQVSRPPAPTPTSVTAAVRLRAANSFTDNTISLAGWTASQDAASSPRPSDRHLAANEQLKEENKKNLKKLLLLSLRHVGIEKTHPEFMSTWKHLYCGCLFALRKELAHEPVDQATMLAVIKNNINFLNVSR